MFPYLLPDLRIISLNLCLPRCPAAKSSAFSPKLRLLHGNSIHVRTSICPRSRLWIMFPYLLPDLRIISLNLCLPRCPAAKSSAFSPKLRLLRGDSTAVDGLEAKSSAFSSVPAIQPLSTDSRRLICRFSDRMLALTFHYLRREYLNGFQVFKRAVSHVIWMNKPEFLQLIFPC